MARKDLENVLRNLYSFLEILQRSRSEEVLSWDKQSLDNALKWAAFAEQIFMQSKNKPYRHQLDVEVQKLGQLHWRLGEYTINLDSLQHSKDILISNLLQNSHLKLDLKKSLLCDVKDIGYNDLTELCSRITSTTALADILMTSQLTSPCHQVDKSQVESSRQCEARLLCQSLSQSLRHHLCAHVSEKLEMFASCQDGIMIIASAMDIASCSLQSNTAYSQSVCDVLLKFFLKQVTVSPNLLWSIPAQLMTRICCQSSDILHCYLQYLSRSGDNLQPDYDKFVVRASRLQHDWRSESDVTYVELRLRLSQLLNTDCQHVVLATLRQLETLTLADEPNVWKHLQSDLTTSQ